MKWEFADEEGKWEEDEMPKPSLGLPALTFALQALEQRVARIERLLACGRCLGSGSIWVGNEQDECPACHGMKTNPLLSA